MFIVANPSAPSSSSSVILWSCVLVLILVGAFALVSRVKRRLKDDLDRNPSATSGFTLSDLRQLHRTGQISQEEFERAKAKIVEAARKAAERDMVKPKDERE